jgi:membrane fusion protein (multidrug efflux system)
MRRHLTLLVVALAAAIAVALAALRLWPAAGDGAAGPPQPPPPAVKTTPADRQPIAVTARTTGSVEAAERATVTAQVTGTVTAIRFAEGQRVEPGSVLVELDSAREAAAVRAAEAELRDARRQLQRLTGLPSGVGVSAADVDEARARRETAQARLAEAEAALAERTVRAAFAGVVGLRKVSPGSLVEPGAEITTLATVDRLKLAFQVPTELLPRLRVGLPVIARAPGFGGEFEGRVTRIDNTVETATRTIAVEAELPDARRLKPGVFVTVDLVLERRSAVVVPEEAVVLEGAQAYVYTVEADGTARRRAIAVGERRPGIAEVLEGLEAGTPVVTAGVQKVQAGQPVSVLPPEPAGETEAGTVKR